MRKVNSKVAAAKKPVRKVVLPVQRKVAGKSGPWMNDDQRAMLLQLLAAGQSESGIHLFFTAAGWGRLAKSSISDYRKKFAAEIEAAKARRVDEALTTGLALKAERIAALKEHATMLEALRFVSDRNGRFWNERAWRQTLEDIALEMGDRKPKDMPQEQTVKVYVGLDPARV